MNKKLVIILSFVFFSVSAIAHPEKSMFYITQFGAVGDGSTVNTVAIQQTIDQCSQSGGGIVFIPEGIFVSGTILLKNGVTLVLAEKAVLLGSTDIADYQIIDGFKDGRGSSMGYCFIGGVDIRNAGISGKGKINGNGKLLLEKNGRGKRPFLVRFVRCSNLLVSEVSMERPAAWTMHFFECTNVRTERVIIRSRGLSNNDGIDIDSCDGVVIKNCDIDSGDDAVCLKTTGPKACRNVELSGCRLNTNQGAFKIGTESFGDFENISFHDCRIENTKGIKLYSVDGAHLKNLKISDISIEKTTLPILIRLGSRLKTFREGDAKRPVGSMEGIRIKNITVKSATQMAVLISGIPSHPVTDVQISNLSVRLSGGGKVEDAKVRLPENEADYPEVTMFGKVMPVSGMYIRHAEKMTVEKVRIEFEQPDFRPAIGGIDLNNVLLDHLQIPSAASSEPFIILETVRNIVLNSIHPSGKPTTFLRVEGESEGIVLHAKKPRVELGDGVATNAVRIK